MKKKVINLENGEATGYFINLPSAPLLVITTQNGYVMCGYLNMAVSNKLGDIAGKVTAVTSFEDVLQANVVEVSEKAQTYGFHVGMTGKEFLNKLLEMKHHGLF